MGIKTLRYYHEIGLLIPTRIDKFNAYRYYDEKCLNRVETINRLKELDFSLETIKEILENHKDDQSLIRFMQTRLSEVDQQISEYALIRDKIEAFIRLESSIPVPVGEVTLKDVPEVFIASIPFKGTFSDIDQHMTRLFAIFGTVANGPPFCLYHDDHYADENMNIECCIPITKKMPAAGIHFYTLPGASMVTIMHEGDYSNIWKAYQKIVDYLNKKDLPICPPSREIYLRGKGKILPGDPEKYLTEIQFQFVHHEDPVAKSIRDKIPLHIHG